MTSTPFVINSKREGPGEKELSCIAPCRSIRKQTFKKFSIGGIKAVPLRCIRPGLLLGRLVSGLFSEADLMPLS